MTDPQASAPEPPPAPGTDASGDTGTDIAATRAPDTAADEATDRATGQTGAEATGPVPRQGGDQAAEQAADPTAAEADDHAPVQGGELAPDDAAPQVRDRAPDHAAAHAAARPGDLVPDQAAARVGDRSPDHAPDHAATQATGQAPEQTPEQTPDRTTVLTADPPDPPDPADEPTPPDPDPPPGGAGQRVGNLWSDAWYDLRHRKMFLIPAFVIFILLLIAAFPQLFTDHNPHDAGACRLVNSLKDPSGSHWFGYDVQGCDVYTKVIWSTRNSIVVGFSTVVMVTVVGGVLGLIAGYVGGWIDGLLSRFADIFFAIPLMLGAILALAVVGKGDALTVALIMAALVWPKIFRLMRGAVIANKHNDYVIAARALGGGTLRVTFRHILPNAIAPVLVYVTISLGEFIAAEAALSYLGVGIQPPGISWGLMISDAQERFLQASHPLLFPSLFLSVTVLSFILMGDAVRDALDPKNR